MTEAVQLRLIQLGGFMAVAVVVWVGAAISREQPLLAAPLVGLVSWYIGKLTAEPLPIVTFQAASTMKNETAAELMTRLSNRPPSVPAGPVVDFINNDHTETKQ